MANTLEVFRKVRRKIEGTIAPFQLTLKSAGLKNDDLNEKFDPSTGYWLEPHKVSSKPPRWIIQFETSNEDPDKLVAHFAKKADGSLYSSSKTIGYINNREGNCAAMVFRIVAAIKTDPETYIFPEWEWLLILVLQHPLPAGTSGEVISNFNPSEGTFVYKRASYRISLLGIVQTSPVNTELSLENGNMVTYAAATEALKVFLETATEGEG